MRKDGRAALVTGGNRGLGFEVCRQLARRGFRVLLTSRSEQQGNAAARALAAEGLDVVFWPLDVAEPARAPSLAAALRAEGRPLDVLVNNAGIALDGFDASVARRTLEVNFFGALRVTDALLPEMSDGGEIVMVSSGVGEVSCLGPGLRRTILDPALTRAQLVELMDSFIEDVEGGRFAQVGWPSSAYRVSKVGLNALVRILARELVGRRIRVNAVCPGWVRTDMGGPGASRSVEEGAASILSVIAREDEVTGQFFRDGRPIPW